MENQLDGSAQKAGSIRSGLVLTALGVLCHVGLYVYVYIGAAQLRATGEKQGFAPLAMPLILAGLVLMGAGAHRILWSQPRGASLPKVVRQIASAAIAIAATMALSFVAGAIAAVLRARGI